MPQKAGAGQPGPLTNLSAKADERSGQAIEFSGATGKFYCL
jgi:hypothetical protein